MQEDLYAYPLRDCSHRIRITLVKIHNKSAYLSLFEPHLIGVPLSHPLPRDYNKVERQRRLSPLGAFPESARSSSTRTPTLCPRRGEAARSA